MGKIFMLGTLAATATPEHYNTCFILDNNGDYLLVDTGCSNRVIDNIEKVGIELSKIHNIFISHNHMDHILGIFWIMRKLSMLYKKNKYTGKLNIYCNETVANSINLIYKMLLRESQSNIIDNFINLIIVKNNEEIYINKNKFIFFDTLSKGVSLYGFETNVNGKKLIFLGDEKCNPKNYSLLKDADYVMHEVFCLEREKASMGEGALIHSSVEDVAKSLNDLNISNLILFHSKENLEINKKDEYFKAGKKFFKGNIIVPNDLDIIELN